MGILEFKNYLYQRPASVSNEKQLLAILNDAMGNDKKKYKVLFKAYEVGILDAIKQVNPPSTEEQQRLVSDLQTKHGLTEQAASHAVDFWIKSFENFSFDSINSLTSFMELPRPIGESDPISGPKLITISYNPIRKEVFIQWNRQQDAESYEIWRSIDTEKATLIKQGSFPLPRFSDKAIEVGKIHSYVVRCKLKTSEKMTEYSNCLQIAVPQDGISFEISEVRISNDSIQLRWTYQTDTMQYIIKRKNLLEHTDENIVVVPNTQFTFIDNTEIDQLHYSYSLECQRRNHVPLITSEIALTV